MVEIIVFPFEHPDVEYKDLDCSDFDDEYKKEGRPIHIMEIGDLNGPSTHPLLETLKKDVMRAEELTINTPQYFVLNPSWSKLQYHYAKSLSDMRDVLKEMIKKLHLSDEL